MRKMESLQWQWLLLAVSTLLAVTTHATPCPVQCMCDQIVFCHDLVNTTWSNFINKLPKNTKHLVIKSSAFTEELPHKKNRWDKGDKTKTPLTVLGNLTLLEVEDSSIVSLGLQAFTATPNVKQLRFNYVTLGNKTLELLSALTRVESVDLSYNRLQAIPESLLQTWSKVRHLNLQHNEIREFSFVVFQHASNLETLDLSHNNISFVHPVVENTENWTFPGLVNLHSNQLSYIHPSVIHNLSHPTELHLGNNPWDCHCGVQWLSDILSNSQTSNVVFPDSNQMQCETPKHLKSTKLMSLARHLLDCEEPVFEQTSPNVTLLFMSERVLKCNVSGYPRPSVYWLTPHGPVVYPDNRYWIPADHALAPDHLVFDGPPHHLHASVRAQGDGSLAFKNFRFYFDGEYTCVAVNPVGMISQSVSVEISVNIEGSIEWSMLWGFGAAIGFLLLGVVFGSLRLCAEKYCCPPHYKPEEDEDVSSDDQYSEDSFYLYNGSPCWSRASPRRSPMKCVTPAEGIDMDHHYSDRAGNIRETLETVRARLRFNMERHVGRMRTRAQNMKKHSHRYMQNMRHTTGHYMKNIRHTSSQYVHKVREGMVQGVEQVKCTVQSMKEMCGTGDLTHTISTISISTDIDSNRKTAVVKKVTFV